MKKIAVLISGQGNNLQAIIDACQTQQIPAEIVCVISNKANFWFNSDPKYGYFFTCFFTQ